MNREGFGHRVLTGEKQDGETSLVAWRQSSGVLRAPAIARRSWSVRQPMDVADGGVDLGDKGVSKAVQKREQGEGREVGCRGATEIAGVGRGVRAYRRRSKLREWRPGGGPVRVLGGREEGSEGF